MLAVPGDRHLVPLQDNRLPIFCSKTTSLLRIGSKERRAKRPGLSQKRRLLPMPVCRSGWSSWLRWFAEVPSSWFSSTPRMQGSTSAPSSATFPKSRRSPSAFQYRSPPPLAVTPPSTRMPTPTTLATPSPLRLRRRIRNHLARQALLRKRNRRAVSAFGPRAFARTPRAPRVPVARSRSSRKMRIRSLVASRVLRAVQLSARPTASNASGLTSRRRPSLLPPHLHTASWPISLFFFPVSLPSPIFPIYSA